MLAFQEKDPEIRRQLGISRWGVERGARLRVWPHWPRWIRTTIAGSKDRCPAIGRGAINLLPNNALR